jgi:hypothetical protein
LIGKALTTARRFKLHSKPVFRKSARFECKAASPDASARVGKRRFGSSRIVIEATCSAAGEQARGPSARTPDLRARARFEHSSDPGRACGATGQLLPPVFPGPTRSALRHASPEHSFGPEGGAGQAVRGGPGRAPAETVRVPGSRSLPRPWPPNARGLPGSRRPLGSTVRGSGRGAAGHMTVKVYGIAQLTPWAWATTSK